MKGIRANSYWSTRHEGKWLLRYKEHDQIKFEIQGTWAINYWNTGNSNGQVVVGVKETWANENGIQVTFTYHTNFMGTLPISQHCSWHFLLANKHNFGHLEM